MDGASIEGEGEMAQPEPLLVSGSAVGVDVGISSFTILSNGEELENPRHLSAILEGD